MNKALFIDRDGVINIDNGYVYKKENFIFIEGIFEVLLYAAKQGYLIIVITNQSGIARGYYSEFIELTKWMFDKLREHNIYITHLYYSPLLPNQHTYYEKYARKPDPGMILSAQKDYDIDLESSVLLGDNYSAGINAGIKTNILFSPELEESNTNKDYYKIKDIRETIQYL